MDIKGFSQASPLGLGWLLGHVSTAEAVTALAQATRKTDQAVRERYGIGKASKEEGSQGKT